MGKKILLIEDHPEMRQLLARSLRNLGYELLEAADGQTGLRLALGENPDLVLLNLSLPGINGLEVARKIKENFKTSHIPIVVCSGLQDKNILKESLKAGVVDYLTKPFSAKKIATVIKMHIGRTIEAED
jgi:two-component system, OmpR family, response regulator VicR